MPRSKQYEVNEAFASSQVAIITSPNNCSNHERGNHVGAPSHPKQRSITTGWWMGMAFASLCLAFILCVAFLEVPGVPTKVMHSERAQVLRKQGYLQIYPVPFVDRSTSRANSLFLSNMTNAVEQLRDVLSDYPPEYTDSYTTCFVDVPTYNRPCYFEKEWLGTACSEENSFGYKEVNGEINPCILLRLENLTDWKPMVYIKSSVDESWIENYDPNFSNIGCMIKDKRKGKRRSVNIYPVKGFPNQFFPVSSFDKSLYLKPSVMIQIIGLPVGESTVLQCWLRVSNAYKLKHEGEVVINITTAATFTSSISPLIREGIPTTTENTFAETTFVETTPAKTTSAETTSEEKPLSTTPVNSRGAIDFSDVN